MKILLLFIIIAANVSVFANIISPCNQGPAFWCNNLKNAKLCGAVGHCIQTIWENEEVENDKDSVCEICLDMVKQARDQLESNETIADLKAVFEGSCKLIPLKPIQNECIKMADDFIPELIEALASQMNPQMVCSVAGLCNNAAIDKMLEEYEKTKKLSYVGNSLSCNNCNVLSTTLVEKFNSTSKDEILENVLNICGKMSSFSDACNSIVLTNFNDFYEQLQEKMSSDAVCHLSGVCSAKYHSHNTQEIAQLETQTSGDDLPCELCEQLVKHLRDVLIANTTEDEFKQVLQGLCGQTKNFKPECLSIVDEYYKLIYETLVNNLDANGACFLIGICPKGLSPAKIDIKIEKLEDSQQLLAIQKNVNQLMETELSTQLVKNGELCTLCEYFIHFVQETITLPDNEKAIKQKLKLICSKSMPKTLVGECDDFVEMYADAIVALIVQETDPREICPLLKMCPKPQNALTPIESKDNPEDKPTCPLCLFAVEQAQIKIKDEKTKENAQKVLNDLCNHFPNNKLKAECTDFVKTYTSELINMLVQDFTPQQICVSIKLCDSQGVDLKQVGLQVQSSETELKEGEFAPLPQCLLCKKVIELVEKELIGKETKQDIIDVLKKSCSKMNKKAQSKCDKFVDNYGELIADLVLKETKPDQICKELMYCSVLKEDITEETLVGESSLEQVNDAPPCTVCEIIMLQLEQELKSNKTKDEVKNALLNICHKIPTKLSDRCSKIVAQYSDAILEMLESVPPKQICQEINLCPKVDITDDILECGLCHGISSFINSKKTEDLSNEEIKSHSCETFPSKYFEKCSEIVKYYSVTIQNLIKDNNNESQVCTKIGKCIENEGQHSYGVVMDDNKSKRTLVGANECTYGPTHWCSSKDVAKKCDLMEYCEKVWAKAKKD